ncbi:MAG: acyltransferase [Mycoplasmataceae bacterium]|nr:acyltransferase [Mycoplasmataceae bacterium]
MTNTQLSTAQKQFSQGNPIKKRSSNVEMLRFILIFFVVLLHAGMNNIQFSVPCFIVITGYFSINQTKNRFLHNFCNYIVFWFIAFLLFLIFFLVSHEQLEIFPYMTKFWPPGYMFFDVDGVWWYYICYLFLSLIMPLLNAGIRAVKKEYLLLVIAVAFLLTNFNHWAGGEDPTSNVENIFYMVCMYTIGAGIKLHVSVKNKWVVISSVIALVVTGGIGFSSIYWNNQNAAWFFTFNSQNTITVIIFAISLFILTLNVNVPYSKIINFLGASTMFIFLYHNGFHRIFNYYIFSDYSHYKWIFARAAFSFLLSFIFACALYVPTRVTTNYLKMLFEKCGAKIRNHL